MCESTAVRSDGGQGTTDVTTALVSAIADVRDADPLELDVCLGDYVDLDALESLVAHNATHGGDVAISFTIPGYDVFLEPSGDILVVSPCSTPGQCDENPRDS